MGAVTSAPGLDGAGEPTRIELTDRQLAILVALTVVSLTAGTPLQLAAAGRTLPLGPADALVALLTVTLPLWYRRMPPLSPFLLSSALFVLWVWISAVFTSIDFRRSVLNAKSVLEAGVLYLAAWHVGCTRYTAALPWAIRLLNTVLSLQIASALWQIISGPAQGYYALKNTVTLPLGDNNYLALFLEFGLMYELLSRRRGWQVFALLDATGIILTFSRGALLATGLTLALMTVALLAIPGQRRASLLVAGALLAAAAVVAATPSLQVLVEAFGRLSLTASSRIELWQDAWEAATWRPFTGVGYGAYESIGTARDAHSLPLALLAETGIPGLALFTLAVLAAWGRVTRAALHPATRARGAEALGVAVGLAVVLMHSLIEPFFLRYSQLWAAVVFAWIMAPWKPDSATVATAPAVSPT